jgi:hypothetical protein
MPKPTTKKKAAPPNILEAMNHPGLFGPWFQGDSWSAWRSVLKATSALPMTESERAFFRDVAEREPPTEPVKEAFYIMGRRSGKDSVASLIAADKAAFFAQQDSLRRGERAMVVCLGCDRDQARIILNYIRAFFTDIPPLAAMVQRETQDGLELNNNVDIAVGTNSFRAVRGRPILCAILDELAFYRDENSASPDTELYNALKPGTATLPGAMIIGISSPHKKSGLLFNKYRDHFGRDSDTLIVKAPTLTMNPTIDPAIIEQALRDDPEAASAEWLAEFRNDLSGYISHDAIMRCVVPGRAEVPFKPGEKYVCFVDPASGTAGGDSFCIGVAHKESWSDRVILDALREFKPPFLVETAINETAALCRQYHISTVTGDHWSGDFIRQRFNAVGGLRYEVSSRTKSAIYLEALPLINAGRSSLELLDNRRLISQATDLERRVTRSSGRESVEHPAGGRDDAVNASFGSIVCANENRAQSGIVAIGVETHTSNPRIERHLGLF